MDHRYAPSDMHRTTLNVPEDLFRQAKVKAASEDVPLSEVLRDLLARWVRGEVEVGAGAGSRREAVRRARATFGMWRDRDPDGLLRDSRGGLEERDRKIEDARLAP